MILRDVMVRNPITVSPDDSLHHASQIMAWTETHHLLVTVGDKRLVGLLSERDILAYRVREPDHSPVSTPVSNAMHKRPQTAGPDDSLTEAAGRLSISNIGCLPVTQKGKLIGLVTRTDVLSAEVRSSMSSQPSLLKIADVMTKDPVTVEPNDRVLDAAQKMSDTGVRHLPVVDETNKVVGILSDRDIQIVALDPKAFSRSEEDGELHLLVGDAMSKPPMHIWPDEDCGTVSALFVQFRASAAPVIAHDGTLVGIVSYVDLLRGLSPGGVPFIPSHS